MDTTTDPCEYEPNAGNPQRSSLSDLLDDGYEAMSAEQCERALAQRRRRISIISADVVEAVAHSAKEEAKTQGKHLRQQMTFLSKAMWVHMIAERLRNGQPMSSTDMRQAFGMNDYLQQQTHKQKPHAKPDSVDETALLRALEAQLLGWSADGQNSVSQSPLAPMTSGFPSIPDCNLFPETNATIAPAPVIARASPYEIVEDTAQVSRAIETVQSPAHQPEDDDPNPPPG